MTFVSRSLRGLITKNSMKEIYFVYYIALSAVTLLVGVVIGGAVSNSYWKDHPVEKIVTVEVGKETEKVIIVSEELEKCKEAKGNFRVYYESRDSFPLRFMSCEVPEQNLFDIKL